jgi:hypothetical protein
MNNETVMLILRVIDKKKASGSFLNDKVFHYARKKIFVEKMKKHKYHMLK